jgi:hypothetical protein
LDVETKRVITVARSVVWRATPDNLGRLSEAVKSFEKKHEGEMTDNLIRALFAGVDDDDTAALGKR